MPLFLCTFQSFGIQTNHANMNNQLEHEQHIQHKHNTDIIVVLNGVQSPENIGMAFRNCDAFAVSEIVLDSPIEQEKKINRISRNTFINTRHIVVTEILSYLKELKNKGYLIVGMEITNDSRNIMSCAELNASTVVLVLGSERYGIDQKVIDFCDFCVHIPRYGKNSSMNVINAMTIGLYEIVKRSSS